jgi:hypothetical protein
MEIDGPNAARMTFRPLAEYQHGPIWPHPTANSQPAFYKRSKQFAPALDGESYRLRDHHAAGTLPRATTGNNR